MFAVLAGVGPGRSARAAAPATALAAAGARLAARFAQRAIPFPPRRATLVALKDEARLEVWADGGDGWRFVRSYLVRSTSGRIGPKLEEGDHQVPEGVYRVAALNPNSRYHLSLRIDYPNAFDRARAREDGRSRLGGDIMIHGDRVSDGCLPVGDAAVEELYALAERIGTVNLAVIVSPMDLRTVDVSVAYARAAAHPRWLRGLYTTIAQALVDFPLSRPVESALPARRLVVGRPRCRPYDAHDCVVRCGNGDVASCARAGLLYANGLGVVADAARARPLLEKACGGGDAFGCAVLSHLYVDDEGPRLDVQRAAALAGAACAAGDGHGCYEVATLCAERLLYPGPGEPCAGPHLKRLYQGAIARLQQDCRGWGAYDCSLLATMYRDGGDAGRARELDARACAAGYDRACERVATGTARDD